ncbi:MAG: hypothetical protein ABSA41_12495 [Terriglobia bacterium]|jgi:hypothetical protein
MENRSFLELFERVFAGKSQMAQLELAWRAFKFVVDECGDSAEAALIRWEHMQYTNRPERKN